MGIINTQARTGGASTSNFVVLPSDVYRMKIIKSVVEENRFADPNKDGSKPLQVVITWEVTTLTEEQLDAMAEAEEDWDTATVWQRINPFYGPVRAGGVSKFQAFIDALVAQGYLAGFDPAAFDPDSLVGIEQRVNVERYIKSQGDNSGQPGNKVVSVLPLKSAKQRREAQRNKPVEVETPADAAGEALPF